MNREFLIGAMLLLSITAKAGDTQLRKTPFGTGAEVGFGLIKYHNTCVWFRVLFVSGDFFRDLREHKTPNGIEFLQPLAHRVVSSRPRYSPARRSANRPAVNRAAD